MFFEDSQQSVTGPYPETHKFRFSAVYRKYITPINFYMHTEA